MAKKKTVTIKKKVRGKAKKGKAMKRLEKKGYDHPVQISSKMLVSNLKGLNYPSEYMTFVLWLALPAVYRPGITKTGARTQEQLAKELGVHRNALTDWKSRPGFQQDFRRIQLAWFEEDVGDIILAQRAQAIKGNTNAAKLILEILGYMKKDEEKDKTPEILAEAIRNVSKFLDK